MEVFVNRFDSTIEVAPDAALLDPVVLRQIVAAVSAELATQEAGRAWEAKERAADGGRGQGWSHG